MDNLPVDLPAVSGAAAAFTRSRVPPGDTSQTIDFADILDRQQSKGVEPAEIAGGSGRDHAADTSATDDEPDLEKEQAADAATSIPLTPVEISAAGIAAQKEMAMGLRTSFGNGTPSEILAGDNSPEYGSSEKPSLIEGETTQTSRGSPPVRNGKKPPAPSSPLLSFASFEHAHNSRAPQPGQVDLQKIEAAEWPAPKRETSLPDPMTLLGPQPTVGTLTDAPSPNGLMPVTVSPLTQTSENAAPQSPYTVPAPHIYVETPVHAPVWSNALGERVLWLMENGQHKAKLHVNPEHLGPIDVTLTLKGNEVGLAFTAAQPEVRSALDLALPQLRETLAQGGVEMGNSTVSADTQGSGQQGADPAPGQRGSKAPARPDDAASNPVQSIPVRSARVSRSLLDTYA